MTGSGTTEDPGSSGTDPGTGQTGSSGTGTGSGSTGTGSGPTSTGSGSDTDSGVISGGSVDCGNQTYACGDGSDNDGDGLVDLADPECTGPCDDDEASFQTGIPGDNVDCRQDCFFDGNSGQGEGCTWDLRCDPNNPGEFIGCEYNGGGNNCDNQQNQPQECLDFCTPLTPPGCDCFGCCTVETDEGSVDIFLNGDPNCSLDNLEACTECMQSEDCVNECEPDECEICFGETELPVGCDDPNCESAPGGACTNTDDCEQFQYCFQGCCYPAPG